MRKGFKIKEFTNTLLFLLAKFHGKPSIFLKIYNHITPSLKDASIQKPPANEITEPITFTVYKLILLQSYFNGCALLILDLLVVNNPGKRKGSSVLKAMC